MTQSNIDYRVIDSSKYPHKQCYGSKQLSKIGQKAKQFTFMTPQDIFQFEVQFKCEAIITGIDLRAKEVSHVTVEMWNQGEKIWTGHFEFDEKEYKILKGKYLGLGEKAQKFDRALVRLVNYPEARCTVIGHLLFKGFKEEGSKKKQQTKNVSTADVFQPATKRKVGDQEKKIFQTRNKEKSAIKKTTPEDLLREVTEGGRNARVKKQEDQLKRAIELSKKEQEKKQGKNKAEGISGKNEQYAPIQIQDDGDNEFFEYDVVDWQKVKKIYEHVTPEWIQAQKKAQRERGIQPRHSISSLTKPKIFRSHSFCLSNISAPQRTKLSQLIRDMGGQILEQPAHGCTVITRKMEGGKISLAKGMGVGRFVRPDYVEDCGKMGAVLDERDYRV